MEKSNGLAVLLDVYRTHQKYQVPYEDIHKISLIAANPFSDVYRATLEIDGVSHSVASKELRLFGRGADSSNTYKVFQACSSFLFIFLRPSLEAWP